MAQHKPRNGNERYYIGGACPALVQHPRLSVVDKMVAFSLLAHRTRGDSTCSITQEGIALELGIEERSVRNSILALRQGDLIDWDERSGKRGPGKGRSHLYDLTGLLALQAIPIQSEADIVKERRPEREAKREAKRAANCRPERNATSRPERNATSRPERNATSAEGACVDGFTLSDRNEMLPHGQSLSYKTMKETPETAHASANGSGARLEHEIVENDPTNTTGPIRTEPDGLIDPAPASGSLVPVVSVTGNSNARAADCHLGIDEHLAEFDKFWPPLAQAK